MIWARNLPFTILTIVFNQIDRFQVIQRIWICLHIGLYLVNSYCIYTNSNFKPRRSDINISVFGWRGGPAELLAKFSGGSGKIRTYSALASDLQSDPALQLRRTSNISSVFICITL